MWSSETRRSLPNDVTMEAVRADDYFPLPFVTAIIMRTFLEALNAQKILLYCLFYCQMHGIYAALFPQYDNKLEAVQGSRNSLF